MKRKTTTTHLPGPKTKQSQPNPSSGTRAGHQKNCHNDTLPSSSGPSNCEANNQALSQAHPELGDMHDVINLVQSSQSPSPEDANNENDITELGQSCYLITNNSRQVW